LKASLPRRRVGRRPSDIGVKPCDIGVEPECLQELVAVHKSEPKELAEMADPQHTVDWRWLEIIAASSADLGPAAAGSLKASSAFAPGAGFRHHSPPAPQKMRSWRLQEASFFACGVASPMNAEPVWGTERRRLRLSTDPGPQTGEAQQPECAGAAQPAAEDARDTRGDEHQEGERASPPAGPPDLGDIVILGSGAPTEFRQLKAIVTKTADNHCTVIVLDETGRYGVGECWPNFVDCVPKSRSLRLGERVVIDGLQGPKTRRLNGHAGFICKHPREGHPTFIRTKASPDSPQLTVCVRLDDPPVASDKSVLMEPRFLVPYEHFLAHAASRLEDALTTLQAPENGPGPEERAGAGR